MLLYTLLTRVSDGMPLVASSEAMASQDLEVYKDKARKLVKQLNDGRAPNRMTIEAEPYVFNYLIEDGVCFLVLSEKGYPKKLVYAYLSDVHKHFVEELQHESAAGWQNAIATAGRAYQFVRFDRTLLRLKREYADPSSKSNKSKLDEELADIRNIMKKNINEVLERGEKLDYVSKRSSEMLEDSKKFKWGAKKLNLLDAWKKYAPAGLALLLVIAVLYWRFLW